jgi:hypothetical protein
MSQEWLSIIEYARKHQISDMTIRRRIKTGRLEAVLRDGKYYIQASTPPREHFFEESPQPPRSSMPTGPSYPPESIYVPQSSVRLEPRVPSFTEDKIDLFLRTGEALIQRLKGYEDNLVKLHGAEKEALQAQIREKDQEINRLNQDREDLKFLVSILEGKTRKVDG